MEILIRQADPRDLERVAHMCHELWPDATAEQHARDVASLIGGNSRSQALFVAEKAAEAVGFLHANLRSHADGCDTSHPVGYVEGWFVEQAHRGRGFGGMLMRAAEDWARSQGCREMASDTWLDHEGSQRAHEALGFEEVDRCVHYRKALL